MMEMSPPILSTGAGDKDTSRQISFEFLFIKTRPPQKLHNGFVFVIQFRDGIRYAN